MMSYETNDGKYRITKDQKKIELCISRKKFLEKIGEILPNFFGLPITCQVEANRLMSNNLTS